MRVHLIIVGAKKMETATTDNATVTRGEMSFGWSGDIIDPELVWMATILWCLVVAIVTIAMVTRIAEPITSTRRVARIVALLLCVTTLIVVSPQAGREVATRLCMDVSSVGIRNEFPLWPSALVAAVSVGVTLIGIRSRKKGHQKSPPVSPKPGLGCYAYPPEHCSPR